MTRQLLGNSILVALMAPGITLSRRIHLPLLRDHSCPSPCDVQIEATRGNPGYTSALIYRDKLAGRHYTLIGGNPRAGPIHHSPPFTGHYWALLGNGENVCRIVSGGFAGGYAKFHFQPQLYLAILDYLYWIIVFSPLG